MFTSTMSSGREERKDGVTFIFVYGTLKRGFYNHSLISELMQTSDAVFLGPHTTFDAFPLVCGPHGIPYLINLPGFGNRIRGEVYSVSSGRGLARLDELEGIHRAHYERLPVAVVMDGGDEVVLVEAYFAHRGFGEAMRKRCGEEGLISEYTLEMGSNDLGSSTTNPQKELMIPFISLSQIGT